MTYAPVDGGKFVLYVPTPHATHEPPAGPEYPATQRHAVMAPLASGKEEWSGHV